MPLTTLEQYEKLGNDIRINPNVSTELANNDFQGIADWYNLQAAPDFWIFKQSITLNEAIAVMDWVNEYDPGFKDDIEAITMLFNSSSSLSAPEDPNQITTGLNQYDPRSEGAREALNSVMAGNQTSKAGILGIASRVSTNNEKLFFMTATGPGGGNGSTQSNSANTEVYGPITANECRTAVEVTEP